MQVYRRKGFWALACAAAAVAALLVAVAPASAYQAPATMSRGQDGGKYVYVTSDDLYSGQPTFDFIDIQSTGTPLAMGGGFQTETPATPLAFPFRFYGTTMTDFIACSSGALSFPGGTYTCPNGPYMGYYYESPDWWSVSYLIAAHGAPLWIDPTVTGAGVYHQVFGTPGNQVEVFQWSHMRYCTKFDYTATLTCGAGAGDLTFQIKLFEGTNWIEVHYLKMDMTDVPEWLDDPNWYVYTATTQGVNGEPSWGTGSATKGLSFRFSCYDDNTAIWAGPCNSAPPSYCFNPCTTFGAQHDAFAIRYYKNDPPTGASITGAVNEDVPTLLQVVGSDPEGRPLFADLLGASLVVTPPLHGTVVPVAPGTTGNGYFEYTSDANYNGPDAFTFRVSDGFARDNTIYTATLDVRPINDVPEGKADYQQVWDNPYLTVVDPAGVLANDLDTEITQAEGPAGLQPPAWPMQRLFTDQTPGAIDPPGHTGVDGTFALNADGSFTYMPDSGYTSPDSFTYHACDDNDASTRHGILPAPPTANPDPATRLCDPNPTTVTLDVRRYALRAQPDDFTVVEDVDLVTAPQDGFATNDAGFPNATVIVFEDAPEHGTFTYNGDGSFTYDPGQNLCNAPGGAPDVLHYHLEDSAGRWGNTVAVAFHIVCVDDPGIFVANQTSYALTMNAPRMTDRFWATNPPIMTLPRWWPYNDELPVPDLVVPGPCTNVPGTVDECTVQKVTFTTSTDNPDLFAPAGQPFVAAYVAREYTVAPWWSSYRPTFGWLNFTLGRDASGSGHINVCLKDDGIDQGTADGPGSVDLSCVTILVTVPGPPITALDSYLAYSGHLLAVGPGQGVLANDMDYTLQPYPAAPLTAQMFAGPAHAISFALRSDGSFTYEPDPGYVGPDSFLYTASDGTYSSLQPQKVTIDVRGASPPGADFSWSPVEPVVHQRLVFHDASGVAGAYVVAWSWDFGDGSSSAQQDPSHTYAAPGSYQVRLAIVDNKGDRAQAVHSVPVGGSNPRTAAGYQAPSGNVAPTADAGADFAVAPGSIVQLTGTSTPATGMASHLWTQEDGPAVTLATPAEPTTLFTAPRTPDGQAVALVFSFTVFDGQSTSAPSRVRVLVQGYNHPPLAHAAALREVTSGAVVVLDASQSVDSDGDVLTYRWAQVEGPSVTLDGQATSRAAFTAPQAIQRLDLAFELQVADGRGPASKELVRVLVRPAEPGQGFTFSKEGGGERVQFHGGGPAARWDFGDGQVATGADPVHTFAPGTYTVTMTEGERAFRDNLEVKAAPSPTQVPASSAPGLPAALLPIALAAMALALRRR